MRYNGLRYNGIVEMVYPDAMENLEFINTAYLKLRIRNIILTGFSPFWVKYFPHIRQAQSYLQGTELMKHLRGKRIIVVLSFSGYDGGDKKYYKKNRSIKRDMGKQENPRKNMGKYILVGEIISKMPCPFQPNGYEYLILDCGLKIIHSAVKNNKYRIGDFIKTEGRLDFEIVHIPAGNHIPEMNFHSYLEDKIREIV